MVVIASLVLTLFLTGINAIMLYAPSIFQASGIQQDPLILTIVSTFHIRNFFELKLTFPKIDRWWLELPHHFNRGGHEHC